MKYGMELLNFIKKNNIYYVPLMWIKMQKETLLGRILRFCKFEERRIIMYCLNCNPKVKLIEQESDEQEGLYYQFYICPKCKTRHYCTSQSGDMFEEYLNVCD